MLLLSSQLLLLPAPLPPSSDREPRPTPLGKSQGKQPSHPHIIITNQLTNPSLSTFSPSGRPGSSPYSTLNVTISDPNTVPAGQTPTGTAVFPPSTGTCGVAFTGASVPWGVEQPCTSDSEYTTWTVTLNEPASGTASGTTNFVLSFKETDNVQIPGSDVTKVFEGSQAFAVGDNLGGECGGSGVCYWALTSAPVAVQQTETE